MSGQESKDVRRAEQIIRGLLALQDMIYRDQPWLHDEMSKSVGNAAMIEVYALGGTYKKVFELGSDMRIRETTATPKHKIRCHINTLLDLMSGGIDMGDAYTMGLLEFEGENFHVHAWKWANYFSRLQNYIATLQGAKK